MELTVLSSKGQIVIPEAVRNRFKIKAGNRLVLFEREGELVLRKEEAVEQVLREDSNELAGWNALAQNSFSRVWNHPDEDIWDKYA